MSLPVRRPGRALDLLPPRDVSVHADLVRERSLIAAVGELSLSTRNFGGTPT